MTEAVVVAYLVSLAVFIPSSGWLGDRFGTKRVFLTALALFVGASALCGQARSLEQLVAFRVLQVFPQEAQGASPLEAGLTTFPEALGVATSTQVVAHLYPRVTLDSNRPAGPWPSLSRRWTSYDQKSAPFGPRIHHQDMHN
jgi:MFS family permease